MLPKPHRLNLKTDFKWVASGRKVEDNLVKLFIKSGDKSEARVAISTSAKVFKDAHDRNRARRLLSHAFEELYPQFPQGINIIALPKQGVILLKSEEVLLSLTSLLKKAKVIS